MLFARGCTPARRAAQSEIMCCVLFSLCPDVFLFFAVGSGGFLPLPFTSTILVYFFIFFSLLALLLPYAL